MRNTKYLYVCKTKYANKAREELKNKKERLELRRKEKRAESDEKERRGVERRERCIF